MCFQLLIKRLKEERGGEMGWGLNYSITFKASIGALILLAKQILLSILTIRQKNILYLQEKKITVTPLQVEIQSTMRLYNMSKAVPE